MCVWWELGEPGTEWRKCSWGSSTSTSMSFFGPTYSTLTKNRPGVSLCLLIQLRKPSPNKAASLLSTAASSSSCPCELNSWSFIEQRSDQRRRLLNWIVQGIDFFSKPSFYCFGGGSLRPTQDTTRHTSSSGWDERERGNFLTFQSMEMRTIDKYEDVKERRDPNLYSACCKHTYLVHLQRKPSIIELDSKNSIRHHPAFAAKISLSLSPFLKPCLLC